MEVLNFLLGDCRSPQTAHTCCTAQRLFYTQKGQLHQMKRSQKVSSGFDPTGGNRAAAPLHIPLARGPLSAGLPCDVLNVCDSITVAARWACLHALQGWRPKCTVYERVLVQCEKWGELAGHQINPPRAFDAEQQMCPNARPCISTSASC